MWPAINRWDVGVDPFSELNRMHRQMGRLFDQDDPRGARFPAVNVRGNSDEVRVSAELAGVDPAKIELTVTGDTLTIEGDRPADQLGDNEEVYRRERLAGHFVRTVRLPYEIDNEKIAARYEHGVLKITLPRSEAAKPRRIQVQS